jgi:Zn-finger nucleic acid-binding protein
MNCPKCSSKFEKIGFGVVDLERCLGCRGLWFDMLEKEDLVKIAGSEAIDIGNDQVGKEYNHLDDVHCPQCKVEMLPMVNKDQSHIKYESCPMCYGTFFDAGEFRDLKEYTVVDCFVEMFRTLRSNL